MERTKIERKVKGERRREGRRDEDITEEKYKKIQKRNRGDKEKMATERKGEWVKLRRGM